jgi:nucleotide-binding universal stress UspA family protein
VYRRAVVALDGSEIGEAILPFIIEIAGPLDLEVVLVRVYQAVPPTVVHGTHVAFENPETARIDAEEYLAPLAVELRTRGIRVTTQVRRGEPADEIVEAAIAAKADLIAMTTHGRSGLGRLLFGSVAETVLRASHLPVCLMRMTEADVSRRALQRTGP